MCVKVRGYHSPIFTNHSQKYQFNCLIRVKWWFVHCMQFMFIHLILLKYFTLWECYILGDNELN